MDWIVDLTPLQIAECIGGIVLLIVVAKYTGLSYSKEKGLCFKTPQKTDAILGIVKAIKESDDRQEAEIKRLGDEVNKNTKDTLRLTFYNEALSPAERLVAGKRYLAAGGNGETERAISALAEKHPETWQGILVASKRPE